MDNTLFSNEWFLHPSDEWCWMIYRPPWLRSGKTSIVFKSVEHEIMAGWWLSPSEKSEFVNWRMMIFSPLILENKPVMFQSAPTRWPMMSTLVMPDGETVQSPASHGHPQRPLSAQKNVKKCETNEDIKHDIANYIWDWANAWLSLS